MYIHFQYKKDEDLVYLKRNNYFCIIYIHAINYGFKLHLDRILCRRLYYRPYKSNFPGRYGDIYDYHELYIRLLQNGIRDIARTYGCNGPLVGHHENRREQRID